MKRRTLHVTIAIATGLLGANCLWPTGTCACSPPRLAIVYGNVSAAGNPVSGAEVRVMPGQISDLTAALAHQTTGPSGRYRLLFEDSSIGTGTLVRVDPRPASGLGVTSVPFNPRWFQGGPEDSVRVDIALVP